MRGLPDQPPQGLRLPIILLEMAALILGLSVIALSRQPAAIWLVGVMLITLHTILFYRLGKIAGRLSAQKLSDFFRGFKQGLMGRPD